VLEKCKHGNNYIQRKCLLFFSLEGRGKKQLKKQQLKQQTATQNFGLFFFFFFHCYFLFDFNNKCISNVLNPSHCTCRRLKALYMKCYSNTHYMSLYPSFSLHLHRRMCTPEHTQALAHTHTHARTHTHTILQPLTSLRIISGNSMRTAYIHKCCDCACVSCDRKI